MTGGLIQLVTTGIQDSPIIGNPEITFFKTVYRQHTNFSLCQNERNLGSLHFNKESSKVIENNGDLLYNQHFKIEIPYFDIVKKTTSQSVLDNGYNINQMSVTFMNSYCLVLQLNGNWYVVPESLFKLSSFEKTLELIDSLLLQPELLPEYINLSNLNKNVTYYQIKDNDITSIISILRVNSTFFEQFWIDWISKTDDINLLNKLITIKSDYKQLHSVLKNRIFNLFFVKNFSAKNLNYFDFAFPTELDDSSNIIYKTETERYFEFLNLYDNANSTNESYDIDVANQYCLTNFFNFNDYKNNILGYNELLVLVILKIIYSTSTNYVFWKKTNIGDNNEPNLNINNEETNLINEWKENINTLLEEVLGQISIKNPIYEKLINNYYITEEQIKNIFNEVKLSDVKDIYIKLKLFMNRFYKIPNYQLSFNNGYINSKYTDNQVVDLYNNDNYEKCYSKEYINYPLLKSNVDTIDTNNEMNNLTPVDIQNIFGVFAEDLVKLEFELINLNRGLKSMFILWKNCVFCRLYKRFLDTYSYVKFNSVLFDNDSNRKLSLYYSLYPSNSYNFNDFKNSFFEMFYKNSWLGTLNFNNTNFLKLKENINDIDINILKTTDFTKINSNKDFIKLNVTNNYSHRYLVDQYDQYTVSYVDTYLINDYSKYNTTDIEKYLMEPYDNNNKNNYKQIKLDFTNNKLYIRYDNFYDANSKITLYYGDKTNNDIISWSSVGYEIIKNEQNFSSIYLVFYDVKKNYNGIPVNLVNLFNGTTAKLLLEKMIVNMQVDYETYLPVVCFNNSSITTSYPNVSATKYYLMRKYNNNEPRILNIESSGYEVSIDNSVNSYDNIKVLTINYIDLENNINPPVKLSGVGENTTSDKYVTNGTHLYRVTFYTATGESDLSESFEITINNPDKKVVKFSNLPISKNYSVVGRRIYRTKANDVKYYFLTDIADNTTDTYIDFISDDLLGKEYEIGSNTKYRTIPNNNGLVEKKIIKLEQSANNLNTNSENVFTIKDLNNNIVTLPKDYENIQDIYIEIINFNKNEAKYNILDETKFSITTNGTVELLSESYSKDYLYWLVNSTNYQDNCKLVPSKNFVPFANPAFILSDDSAGGNINGTYKYKISFYNTNTKAESLASDEIEKVVTTNKLVVLSNLSPIYDNTYNSWNIYKTKEIGSGDTKFYLIGNLLNTKDTKFIDKEINPSSNFFIKPPTFKITQQINTHLINNFNRSLVLEDQYLNWNNQSQASTFTLPAGTYKYTVTFYDNISGEETTFGTSTSVVLAGLGRVKIQIPISNDSRVTKRRIYRTEKDGNTFKLLYTSQLPSNIIDVFFDNIQDASLGLVIPSTNIKTNKYNILKLKINTIAPNLSPYLSHSTDFNFANDKNLSDLNDYIFNKPFLMLVNNQGSNSFNNLFEMKKSFETTNGYFYNIPFKINSSSIIKINDTDSKYIMPLSSQQFFNKTTEENYYSVNLTDNKMDDTVTNQIIQTRFNPAYDEFNLSNEYLNLNNYSYILIDLIVGKINDIIDINPDYKKIIDTIDQTNSKFVSNIKSILDYSTSILYGKTTKFILSNLFNINKISNVFNNKLVNYDLLNYLNLDYLKYSHNAYNFGKTTEKDIVNIKINENINSNLFRIISPIYSMYIASNKISSNLEKYLNDVKNFFSSHINYVNSNIDYLNISDPNNYSEKFLSTDEIKQDKYNNFYTYDKTEYNQLNLLYPILESNLSNISEINIQTDNGKTSINNFTISDNKTILTKEFTENILENNFYDSKFKFENRNETKTDKFNYLGLCNINLNNEVNFEDKYVVSEINGESLFELDDNSIYNGTPDVSTGRYQIGKNSKESKLNISSMYSTNPSELKFGESNRSIQMNSFLSYYYKIKIIWDQIDISLITGDVTTTPVIENTLLYDINNYKIYYGLNGLWILKPNSNYYFIVNSNDPWGYFQNKSLFTLNGNGSWNLGISPGINIQIFILINQNYYSCVISSIDKNSAYLFVKTRNSITLDFNEILYSNLSYYGNYKSQKIKEMTVEECKFYNFEVNFNNNVFDYFKFGNKFYNKNDIIFSSGPQKAFLNNPLINNDYNLYNSFLYDLNFVFINSNDLNDFDKITANDVILDGNGNIAIGPEINKYVLIGNKLYFGVQKTGGPKWELITSGNYYITSTNLNFDKKYCTILPTGEIKTNTIFLYTKKEFDVITANLGDSTNVNVGTIGSYIIDNNNLYLKENGPKWTLVKSGNYIINSNNTSFDKKKVQINLDTFKQYYKPINATVANNFNVPPPIPNGYYIITNSVTGSNSDVNYFYEYFNGAWLCQTNGYYKISSTSQTYNNKVISINSNGTINIINETNPFILLTANQSALNLTPANGYYIIGDKLYQYNGAWTIQNSGFYKLISDLATYDNKYVFVRSNGTITIYFDETSTPYFTEITANQSSLTLTPSNGFYIINNKLYEYNNQWIIQTFGYYKITSDINTFNNCFVRIENDGQVNTVFNSLVIYNKSYNKIEFNKIIANEGDIKDSTVNASNPNFIINGKYIIDNDKLYKGVSNHVNIGSVVNNVIIPSYTTVLNPIDYWQQVISGFYYITSNNLNYNNKYVNIENESTLNIVNYYNEIVANNGLLTNQVVNGSFMIYNNLLYQGINNQWNPTKTDYYLIKSNNSNYNNKYVEVKNGNILIVANKLFKPANNYVNKDSLTPMSIKNSFIYSYYQDYDFSKKLGNVNYDNWVLLIDLNRTIPRNYMLKISELKSKQIPSATYNSWILPMTVLPMIEYTVNISVDEFGNLTNISGIPEYSYYIIKYNGNMCVYYYEKGTTVTSSDNIPYYNIRGSPGSPLNIKKIYLINNSIFNTNSKQLLKIYNNVTVIEDFNKKEVFTRSFSIDYDVRFDLVNNMSYKSSYINSVYDIKYSNDKTLNLKGDNIFIVNLFLKHKVYGSVVFIYPIFLKKKEEVNIDIPKIFFKIDTYENNYRIINPNDANGTSYVRSFVTINYEVLNPIFDLNNKKIILSSNFTFGKINDLNPNYEVKSLSPYLLFDPVTKELTIKAGYDIYNEDALGINSFFHFWKMELTNVVNGFKTTIIFWTFFTNNSNLFFIQEYLKINLNDSISPISSIYEPYYDYTFNNFCKYFDLYGSFPDVFYQSGDDLKLKYPDDSGSIPYTWVNKELAFKYYIDTRHVDAHSMKYELKKLDYNYVSNIKPMIEKLSTNVYYNITNQSYKSLYDNIMVYILLYVNSSGNKTILPFLKSEYDTYKSFTSTSLSVYYSISLPVWINNKITIYPSSKQTVEKDFISFSNFIGDFYGKMFLEMGDIIIMDGNYFYVEGLNVFTQKYDLKLIRQGKDLRYTYSGYFMVGNYLIKNNDIMPKLEYNDTTTYKADSNYNDHSLGEIYYSNVMSKIFIKNSGFYEFEKNINVFPESYLNVKLFTNSGKLYLFDNFVKIRKFDYIYIDGIGLKNIFKIMDFRDGEIILDSPIPYPFIIENENKLSPLPNNCKLIYQPFEVKYINFDTDGTILSETIPDNKTIIYDYIIIEIAKNLTLASPVVVDEYVYQNNKLYKGITGTPNSWKEYLLSDQVVVGTYLIADNKLYIGTSGTPNMWKTVNGNYKLKSENYYAETNGTIHKYESRFIPSGEIVNDILEPNKYYLLTQELQNPIYNNQLVKTDSIGKISSTTSNVFVVRDNKIEVDSTFGSGYKYVKIWSTDYWSQFENVLEVPETGQYTINNNYSVKINLTYDSALKAFYFNKTNLIINTDIFYFLQPVQTCGTFNYIKSVITTSDKVYFYLLTTMPFTLNNGDKYDFTFSPKLQNTTEFYSQLKISYNFGIQTDNYKILEDNLSYNFSYSDIEVTRYALKNDELVFIEKYHGNKPIIFKYGKTIAENEILNNINNTDGYENIYFYKYNQISNEKITAPYSLNGKITNFDTLIGSYHLIVEKISGTEHVHLAKIIYPDKLKIYTNYNSTDNENIVDRVFNMKINTLNEFSYSSLVITESRNLVEINTNQMEIIQKYNIQLIETPEIIIQPSGITVYKHKFITTNVKINKIFKTVYIDSALTKSCVLTYQEINGTTYYFITSNEYISNDIKIIYTKLDNYLVSTSKSKKLNATKKLSDTTVSNYIEDDILETEKLTSNIIVSKINPNELSYYYLLVDNSKNFSLSSDQKYTIDKDNNVITYVNNNNRTIELNDVIDNDTTETSNSYYKTELYVENNIDTSIILDPIRLFNDVKQLRVKLIANSYVEDKYVFYYLKPWKAWSALNSINKVPDLQVLFNKNYVGWENNQVVIKSDNPAFNYSYLTNNELKLITTFVSTVAQSQTAKDNFIIMRNQIEPYILNNLTNWLYNPSFFFDVKNNINKFLSCGKFNAYFDGTNIIFNNDPIPDYVIIDGVNEVASYLTNEFVYDSNNNIAYRSDTSFSQINNQIDIWINKKTEPNIDIRYWGVSIHKLCRYLVQIGNELVELIDYFVKPFTSTPEYIYNNPLKFIINKLWEKYHHTNNLDKLNKEFTDNLVLVYNINYLSKILSSINYYENLTIGFTGVYSNNIFNNFTYLKEFIISNLTEYNPNILVNTIPTYKLFSDVVYPYSINFTGDEIKPNVSYSIDFLNGQKISEDIVITSPVTYPDQLSFYSSYNIKPSDFIVVKQNNIYNIITTENLGHSYFVSFDTITINVDLVDQVFNRNYNLPIVSKDLANNKINLLVPYTISEINTLGGLTTLDTLELRNSIGIKSISIEGTKQYITFYSNKFNFISGKTILKTKNNIYLLQKNNDKYYVEGVKIDDSSYDVTIITMVNATQIVDMKEILFQYSTNPTIDDTKYRPENDNVMVPIEFALVNTTNNLKVTPSKVNTLGDNKLILHFTTDDYDTIKSVSGWNTITQVKKLDQEITNQVKSLELENEYLYRFLFTLNKTTNTTIYLYDQSVPDIDIPNGVYEPTINKQAKTSIYLAQKDNQTLFTTSINYPIQTLDDSIKFIQKNLWEVPNYTVENNTAVLDLSDQSVYGDLVLQLNDKFYYKFGPLGNEKPVDKFSFIYSNGILIFDWTYGPIIGDCNFIQYYIESDDGTLTTPSNNRKAKLTFNYKYQYNPNDKFYFMPYSGTGKEFDDYLYIMKTTDLAPNGKTGFEGGICDDPIYLFTSGQQINGKIFDRYFDEYIYLVFSVKELIDLNNSYTYKLVDLVDRNMLGLSYYQNSLLFADYYKQDSIDYIYLFINDSVHEYKNSSDLIQKPNKFYLVSYIPYAITNIFNDAKFIQTEEMKKVITYSVSEVETKETPIWNRPHKLFEYIRLYFNDQLMEELNEDIFMINYYLYYSEERRRQTNNITKIRLVDNQSKWEFYIPLIFWFAGRPGLSLPLIALPHTEIRLVYKLNDFKTMVSNNLEGVKYEFSNGNPEVKIKLNTDFILLDTIERKLFGSLSHEYIIERFLSYPTNYINKKSMVIGRRFSGLIKDIHMISKPINTTNTFYSNVKTKYDSRFDRYNIALNYYYQFVKNNRVYTSIEQKNYAFDIEVIEININNLQKYMGLSESDKQNQDIMKLQPYIDIQRLIDEFSGWEIWDTNYDLLKYLMYYEIIYLYTYYEPTTENGNKKNYILSMYLKYLYSNKKIVEEISPLESLGFKVDGTDLFAARDYTYFSDVVPVTKFKNTSPTGFYTYSFSLYPLEDQNSGHLNFTNFEDVTMKIESNDLVESNPYMLHTIVKEYNIIRIMSGLGATAWIN